MRTDLERQRIQRWLLLGLNPWHRMILRQSLTDTIASSGVFPQFNIVNHSEVLATSAAEFSNKFVSSHAVVIARETFLNASLSHPKPLPANFSKDSVALIWDWSVSGRETLSWATCIGFAGVIFDIATLRSWVSVIAHRGAYRLEEPHPILAQIEVPTLTRTRLHA